VADDYLSEGEGLDSDNEQQTNLEQLTQHHSIINENKKSQIKEKLIEKVPLHFCPTIF
jgi:hypothetical protein